LLGAATILAFCVVGLGAYVRLSDAGLGCPDWPGCYGQLLGVPEASHEMAQASAAFPDRPVDVGKAWKEMIHRYAAGALGLLVLAIAAAAWRQRRRLLSAENALLLLIVLQAALGMWTVTLLLKPLIVTLHLLGGMATWATLVVLWHRQQQPTAPRLSTFGRLALAVVFLQIGLGGWVSSNYAAVACNQFPSCRAELWWPAADFSHGFTLLRELGSTASGQVLSFAALTAIHLGHRLGALLVLLVVGTYALRCRHDSARRGNLILGALALQLALGIANVLLQLPLPLAVLHNLGAAALLACLILSAHRTATN
jgi:cytochrome c oxidase assembly protein subunit 15